MSEVKRRRTDDDAQTPLYTLKLECPVCFGRLGYERGMVMGVTTCQPMAHALCSACFASLPRIDSVRPNCPLCRQTIMSFLPLAGLTDVEADTDAAAALRLLVTPRVPLAQPPPPRPSLPAPRVIVQSPPSSLITPELRRQRENFICGIINELLRGRLRAGRTFTPGDAFRIGSEAVPRFDQQNSVAFGGRWQRVTSLRAIANDLLPSLRARYPEFMITVNEEQTWTQRQIGYLMYRLVYVGAPPPPMRPEPLPGMLAADYQAQVSAYERAQVEAADRRLAEQLQAQ